MDERHVGLIIQRDALKKLAERSEFIKIEPVNIEPAYPPEKYVVTFTCRGIAGIDGSGAPQFSEFHQVLIDLMGTEWHGTELQGIPYRGLLLKWLTPIWHPNIEHLPPYHVCPPRTDPWGKGSLAELLITLGEMIQYKIYHAEWSPPFPIDREVATWVLEYAEPRRVITKDEPVDKRPLVNDKRIVGVSESMTSADLTVDLETPDGTILSTTQIPSDAITADVIADIVDQLDLGTLDAYRPTNYSLEIARNGVSINNNDSLWQAGVRNGDLIRLVTSPRTTTASSLSDNQALSPRIVETSRRLSIFLCHSSHDKQAIRNLHRRLLSDGFDPWLDEEKLLPGQDWEYEIPRAVRGSDVVIVFLSHSSINKTGYLQKEIKYALDVADEQLAGTIFLIPLKGEECPVPDRLRRWQWVNLFEDSGYERLKQSLNSRANELGLSAPNAPQ